MRKWVLWGHHLAEFKEMFAFDDEIKKLKVLEFGCGPTTFNQEMHAMKAQAKTIDPWFISDPALMEARFVEHLQYQLNRIEEEPKYFDFERYGGKVKFIEKRRQGMQAFFHDYAQGLNQGRYFLMDADVLPFANASFDLALSSNYFFADLPDQNLDFHLHWIHELTRVANELRIYPLTDQVGQVSELLGPVLLALQNQGYLVSIEEVPFRLFRESKAMMKIRSNRCQIP
jgi:hypothetical protein